MVHVPEPNRDEVAQAFRAQGLNPPLHVGIALRRADGQPLGSDPLAAPLNLNVRAPQSGAAAALPRSPVQH